MCGHYGLINRSGVGLNQELVHALHWNATSQGKGAWGVIMDAPTHFDFQKERGCNIKIRQHDLDSRHFLLGHTRAATSGSTQDNNNNHPVLSQNGNVLTNHNGFVHDKHIYLFLYKMGIKIQPYCQVDTLALSEAMAAYIGQGNGLLRAAINTMALTSIVHNNWIAAAIASQTYPGEFILCKQGAPLHLAFMKDFIIYATHRRWIDDAVDVIIKDKIMSPEHFVVQQRYDMKEEDIIHVNNNKRSITIVNSSWRNAVHDLPTTY